MTYQKNLSGWIKAQQDHSIQTGNFIIEENKLVMIDRLRKSNLPTYEFHILSLNNFYQNQSQAQKIFDKYDDRVVLRAVPTSSSFQRFTYIDQNLDSIISDLNKKIDSSDEEHYKILINEYDPAEYCGVVISEKNQLTIEMAKEPNLEKLCHAQITPWSAIFKNYNNHDFRRMDYLNVKESDKNIKQLMWYVVKSLSKQTRVGNIPYYQPRLGYFEFVYSKKSGKLLFIDASEK